MENTITFVNVAGMANSWNDWGLISMTTPVVQPPTPKTEYVDLLSAADGSVDFTMNGNNHGVSVNLQRRMGGWVFFVQNKNKTWNQVYEDLYNAFNNKHYPTKVIMSYDTDHYYYGYITVNERMSDEKTSRIMLNYDLDPYKRTNAPVNRTGNMDWTLTDLFITYSIFYGQFNVDQNGKWRTIINPSATPVTIAFNCSNPCQMTINSRVTQLASGRNEFVFPAGDTEVHFLANSPTTISVDYSLEGKSL